MKQIVLIFALFVGVYSFGQCPNPGDVMKPDSENGWEQNSQSKSGALRPGDDYEMRFVAQGGVTYRIDVVSGVNLKEFSNEDIDFQLVVKEASKVTKNGREVYENNDVILYDSRNTEDKAIFYSERSRRMIIRVRIKDAKEDESKLIQCAVVYIESKSKEKLGFH